jgi:thiamine biosynthesis protein ThiI
MSDAGAEEVPSVFFFCHPHELWLKGGNRKFFETVLLRNLRHQLKAAGVTATITNLSGRHLITAAASDVEKVRAVLPRVFGIANFGQCWLCERDLDVLKSRVLEYMSSLVPIVSFKVECSRVDKSYIMTSQALSVELGAAIRDRVDVAVSLHDPAVTVFVEVLSNRFVYFTERSEGALGLPVQASGSVAMLISGGVSSPVAAWMMMRRGCGIVYVHFHSGPYGEWRASVGKIRKIVRQLSLYGGRMRFHAVPIGESQRLIATQVREEIRLTLYRRLMIRIAKKIAEANRCQALATGDSLGQVASQTIDSMTTIQNVVEPMLIMRPLLAFDRDEIVARAQAIGTHEFSTLPGGDCSSHMLPKSASIKPKIQDAEEGEAKLDINAMVEAAMQADQVINVNEPWNEDEETAGAACPCTFEE